MKPPSRRARRGAQQTFYVIKLEEVFVTSYSTGGSKGDNRPFDNFSLAFGKITIDYRQQNAGTGITNSSSSKSWDLRTNMAGRD